MSTVSFWGSFLRWLLHIVTLIRNGYKRLRMKTKGVVLAMIFCSFALVSCKTSPPSSKCGPCPEYAMVFPAVDVRIVDKTTGADLFLSPGSPYKLSDLKITSTYTESQVNFTVDSSQNNNRFLRLYAYPSQTFTIKLASLTADNLQVVLKTDSPQCCPFIKLGRVLLNDSVICNPCNFGQMVVIKK